MSPPRCIRCDAEVESCDADAVNHPYGATAFVSHGHYGSTIFDPMNGCYLEVNVCDACLARLAKRGQVLLGQNSKPVESEVPVVGQDPSKTIWVRSRVGQTPVQRELVVWRPGLEDEGAEDTLFIEPEEVGSDLYPEIRYHVDVEDFRESLRRHPRT